MRDTRQGMVEKMGSIGARLSGCVALVGLVAAIVAPSAGATNVYLPTEVILSNAGFALPGGMAVDRDTGSLYIGMAFGQGKVHKVDGVTGVETSFGEGNYESVAVNPTNGRVYALTRTPSPIRIEIYNSEEDLAGTPIAYPTGKGVIGSDSAGNVFSPDVGAINEQQKFTVAATGGTYTLTFNGQTTGPLAWNAGGFEVQEALELLSSVGSGNVSVGNSGQTYTVTYQGTLEKTNVPQLTADSTGLTGGVVNNIATTVQGANSPPSVKELTPAGATLQTLTCAACSGGVFTATPVGVALDGSDNLYVADNAAQRVVVFHATPGNPTDYTTIPPTVIATGVTKAIAVDAVTGQFFVGGDDGSGFHVKGYSAAGTQFADFASGIFPGTFASFGGEQLAVNSSTGMVYVDDLIESPEGTGVQIYGFSPAPPPTIEAEPATVEASQHATMNNLLNPNGTLVLSCKFEYGPTTAYGTTVPCNDPGFGSDPVVVSAEATGLTPDTDYHYRVTATNEGGTTVGPDEEFTTLIEKASASTGGASSVLQSTVTLEGSINPGGNPLTECRFEYGSDGSYGKQVPCASLPGSGNSPVTVTGPVSGLEPNSTYHYRLVAINAGGTQSGDDRTVKTLPKAPSITTGGSSKVGPDVARILGTVNPEGSVARYQFEFGPTTAYGQSTASRSAVGTETLKVNEDVSGLQPATAYHYRLVATGAGGTTHGADQTFTTGPRPIGRVYIPAKAPLKNGKAAIELQCRGVAIAECQGTLVLRARIKKGIRFILVKVGSNDFDFFGGQKQVVSVPFNAAGMKVIAQSEGEPIPGVVSAANKNRVVRLSHGGGSSR